MSRSSTPLSFAAADSPSTTLLPASWYFDPQVYGREREALFHRSWIHVGHASRIPETGDYLTYEVGGQSVIVMRGAAGDIRAFYNVCRHRASQLLDGEGNVARIICPYHNWTYDLDGHLVAARHTETVAGFDRSCWGLRSVRLDAIAGFLFVCLDDDAPDLTESYPGLGQMLYDCEPEIDRLVHAHRMTYDLACNWKIAVENYCEAYHVRTIHPGLYRGFDMASARWEIHDRHVLLHLSDATSDQGLTDILNDGQGGDSQTYDWQGAARTDLPSIWMWPMVMFERMPGRPGLFTYNHIPLGPERTLQVVDFYFTDSELSDQDRQQIDYVDLVRREDLGTIERVQRGIHSKGWGKGPLMVGPDVAAEWSEAAVLHFQTIVRQHLGETAAD